jgi:hypothetical protein
LTANARVQERYNLAFDAIKTFHTGVFEEFLLREEKFKDSRNRLVKSASDFYGKLSASLGKETDIASRQALAASKFELAKLAERVGRKDDALAAHRAVLAMREELAAERRADAGAQADVGRSLIEVASLLRSTGQFDAALAAYRRSESLLAGLMSSARHLRSPGIWPTKTPVSPSSAVVWESATFIWATCFRLRVRPPRRRRNSARLLRSSRSCWTTTPPTRDFAEAWRFAGLALLPCC